LKKILLAIIKEVLVEKPHFIKGCKQTDVSLMLDQWIKELMEGRFCSPQQPHIDPRLPPRDKGGFYVCITALFGPYAILVWPGSHKIIRALGNFHGGPYNEAFKQRMPGFEELSTAERDILFVSQQLPHVKEGGLTPVIIEVPEGVTIWLDGRTIHAGMPGKINAQGSGVSPGYRVHQYFIPETEDVAAAIRDEDDHLVTSVLDCLADHLYTPAFRDLFWDHSRPQAERRHSE